jgi:hypothetical protein
LATFSFFYLRCNNNEIVAFKLAWPLRENSIYENVQGVRNQIRNAYYANNSTQVSHFSPSPPITVAHVFHMSCIFHGVGLSNPSSIIKPCSLVSRVIPISKCSLTRVDDGDHRCPAMSRKTRYVRLIQTKRSARETRLFIGGEHTWP